MHFYQWLATTQGIMTLLIMCAILALSAWITWGRRYVGMGFVLGYYGEGKALPRGVYVLSRLIGSPAHKAGLQKFDEVLAYDGRSMATLGAGELESFITRTHKRLRSGSKIPCRIRRGEETYDVTLEAAVITGSIPVHLPQARPHPDDPDYHDYHYGLAYCQRTGEFVPTMKLSDRRLNEIFGA